MGYISDEQINELKDKLDIVDVVGEYVQLKKAGSSFTGLCPFHGDKHPSFSVSRDRNMFNCFSCHEKGDAISFIMKIENVSYIEALKILADKVGMELEEHGSGNKAKSKERRDKEERLLNINRMATLFYYEKLITSRIGLEYIKNRGLKNNIINSYYLGYADGSNSLYDYMLENKVDINDLLELGLIAKSNRGDGYYDKFRDRIIYPIFNNKNKIIGFGGRTINDSKVKYLNSPESQVFIKGNNLYGFRPKDRVVKMENVILVEGYMDVIGLYNHGIDYAFASLGTALTENQAKMVKRFGKNVYIAYDGDDAGIKATLRAIEIFDSVNVDVGIIEIPGGMDPDEYIKAQGKDAFYKLIINAKSALDYKFYRVINEDLEKFEKIKNFISFLAGIDGSVIREIYIERGANYFDVPVASIREDVKNFVENKKNSGAGLKYQSQAPIKGYKYPESRFKSKKISDKDDRRKSLERELIVHCMINRRCFEYLSESTRKFVRNEAFLDLYQLVEEEYNRNIDRKELKDVFSRPAFYKLEISDHYKTIREMGNVDMSRLEELLKRVERFNLIEKKDDIQERLTEQMSSEEKMELLKELADINKMLTTRRA